MIAIKAAAGGVCEIVPGHIRRSNVDPTIRNNVFVMIDPRMSRKIAVLPGGAIPSRDDKPPDLQASGSHIGIHSTCFGGLIQGN